MRLERDSECVLSREICGRDGVVSKLFLKSTRCVSWFESERLVNAKAEVKMSVMELCNSDRDNSVAVELNARDTGRLGIDTESFAL